MELGRITVIPDAHRTGKLYLYRELRMIPGMAPSEVISAQAAEDDLGQLSVTSLSVNRCESPTWGAELPRVVLGMLQGR